MNESEDNSNPGNKGPIQKMLESKLKEYTGSPNLDNQSVSVAHYINYPNLFSSIEIYTEFGHKVINKIVHGRFAKLTKLVLDINLYIYGKKLADFLTAHSNLRVLNLEYTTLDPDDHLRDQGMVGLQDEGCVHLAKAVKDHKNITTLILIGNYIGDEGVIALANAVKNHTSLQILDLNNEDPHKGIYITNTGAIALATAIEDNHTLKTLDLRDHCIGSTGIIAFAKALQKNNILEELYVDIGGSDQDLITAFQEALRTNNTIIKINFPNSLLTDNIYISTRLNKNLKAKFDLYTQDILKWNNTENSVVSQEILEKLNFYKDASPELKDSLLLNDKNKIDQIISEALLYDGHEIINWQSFEIFQLTILQYLGLVGHAMSLDELLKKQGPCGGITFDSTQPYLNKTFQFYSKNGDCKELLEKCRLDAQLLQDEDFLKKIKIAAAKTVHDEISNIFSGNQLQQQLVNEVFLDSGSGLLLGILQETIGKEYPKPIEKQIEQILIDYNNFMSNSCTKVLCKLHAKLLDEQLSESSMESVPEAVQQTVNELVIQVEEEVKMELSGDECYHG